MQVTFYALLLSVVIHYFPATMLPDSPPNGSGGSGSELGKLDGKGGKSKDGKGGKGKDNHNVKFLPKPSKAKEKSKKKTLTDQRSKVQIIEKKEEKKHFEETKMVDHKCIDFYTGIGIRTGSNCDVTEIAPGYSADRAGLKVGDIMAPASDGSCPGRGPEGSILNVAVTRGTKQLTFGIVRERICTDGP
jgi:hypothetical protein